MVNLEQTLNEVAPRKEQLRQDLPLEQKPAYEGLQKIEDRAYQGPTSVKYWM